MDDTACVQLDVHVLYLRKSLQPDHTSAKCLTPVMFVLIEPVIATIRRRIFRRCYSGHIGQVLNWAASTTKYKDILRSPVPSYAKWSQSDLSLSLYLSCNLINSIVLLIVSLVPIRFPHLLQSTVQLVNSSYLWWSHWSCRATDAYDRTTLVMFVG